MIDELYSREILRRATQLMHVGRLDHPQASADRVAKLCGSTIHVELNLTDATISEFAMQVQACALGQAAAAIVSQHIVGAPVAEVVAARDAMRAMLKGDAYAYPERFDDLKILDSVRDYPARHASTLLILEAISEAISQLQHGNAA